MPLSEFDRTQMRRAVELARRGEGYVEPNPMVGCVLAQGETVVAEGWHRGFGMPHAEAEALNAAGDTARGATAYITLEPCAHEGKTPPCANALLAAGVGRVVIGRDDPNPRVAGGGAERLAAAGLLVEVLDESEAALKNECCQLIEPFVKLATAGRPWVIAKWAMTLDGRIATRTGSSQWISSEESRALVHRLRGRVDGVLAGAGTVLADDPLLTARPAGPRVAARIVLDDRAELPVDSRLVATAGEAPVLAVVQDAGSETARALADRGVELLCPEPGTRARRLGDLLDELGRRGMTNLLVEGGPGVLGGFFDAGLVDEVWAFVAPKVVGGSAAPGPVGGEGVGLIAGAWGLAGLGWEPVGDDLLCRGRLRG
ncbi:MAG: bifunctional diaminohydroxyphosphoribosylaminopyrimidine deaminase/5-amino-6-(5-phosphoribosylamino)uracil reductase RibD [Planctomycetota bacterium]